MWQIYNSVWELKTCTASVPNTHPLKFTFFTVLTLNGVFLLKLNGLLIITSENIYHFC